MPLEEKQRVITASSGTMKTNKQDDKIKLTSDMRNKESKHYHFDKVCDGDISQ
jgi:hypothetical protein